MKNTILLSLLFTVFSMCVAGQTPSLGFGNRVAAWQASGSCIDQQGNLYSIGYYRNTVDFDPGSGVYNLVEVGYQDAYILKLDAFGNFVWAKSIANNFPGFVQCTSVKTDNNNDLLIAGDFSGIVDFDPDTGVVNLSPGIGSNGAYLLKLTNNGDFVWVKHLEGKSRISGLTVDPFDNILLTGDFEDTVDFDPGTSVVNRTAAGTFGSPDVFVLKLDSTGAFNWVKTIGGFLDDWGSAITSDQTGNVITVGYNTNQIDANPGSGVSYVQGGGWIQKLNPSGGFVWAKGIAADINSVQTDQANKIVLSGEYRYTVDFDPSTGVQNLTSIGGSLDCFVLKLNSSGGFEWVKGFGNSNSELLFDTQMDMFGNVFSIGRFISTVDFDPDTSIYSLTAGNYNVFIQKLSPTGQFEWARNIGSNGSAFAFNIPVSNYGNVYVSGNFSGTADLDPEIGTHNVSSGGVFNLKWNSCSDVSRMDTLLACNPITWSNGDFYNSDTTVSHVYLSSQQCDSTVITTILFEEPDLGIVPWGSGIKSLAQNVNYQWLDCDNAFQSFPNDTLAYFIPPQNGSFAVQLTSANCVDTTECFVLNNFGIDVVQGSNFKLFPNPSEGIVHISSEDFVESIYIYDQLGQLVIAIESPGREIDLSEVQTGVFIVSINLEGGDYLIRRLILL